MVRRIHPLVFWPLAVLLVFAGAVLLAAPLHRALMDLGVIGCPADPAELSKAFLQVFRRLLLAGLAVLFFAGFRPWRGGLLRFGLRPPQPRLMVAPFLVVTGVLFAVLAWQLLMGWLTWEDPLRLDKFALRVVRYTGAGLLIACLEEWFFRGWMGEFAQRHHGPRLAVILPALGYALVHAFRPTVLDQPVTHDAAGALEALGDWLAFMFDVEAFGPSLIGLFLFALMLTALYRRSGTLWPSIGAHAAGIMVLFSYGALTERDPARTWAGTRLLYDGPVVWIVLAIAAWRLWPRGARRDAAESSGPPRAPTGSSAQ